MLKGVFEIAFKLFHIPANLIFQLLSMELIGIYLCRCVPIQYRKNVQLNPMSLVALLEYVLDRFC